MSPFIFFILLILFSLDSPLWAAPAVHSAYPSCNSLFVPASKESGRPTRPPPMRSPSSLASQLYDASIDDVLDLVMSPSPLPHHGLY